MSGYFSAFTDRWMKIDSDEYVLMNNIFNAVAVPQEAKDNVGSYVMYDIEPGETPDMISRKAYGTSDYWWVIMLFNDIYDMDRHWYIDPQVIRKKMIESEYDENEIMHYLNIDDVKVDIRGIKILLGITGNITADELGLTPVTRLDEVIKNNDKRRWIKVPIPEYIPLFQSELDTISRRLSNGKQ